MKVVKIFMMMKKKMKFLMKKKMKLQMEVKVIGQINLIQKMR